MTAPENQTILRKNSYEGEIFSFSICHIDDIKRKEGGYLDCLKSTDCY